MVHGDTQLVDTLSHLRFHGIPAVGHHHSHCRAGHHSSADTDPKSGTHTHLKSLLCGLSVVWPLSREKNAPERFARKRQIRYNDGNDIQISKRRAQARTEETMTTIYLIRHAEA